MLKCSASLWHANLGDLAREIQRLEPYADRFHLDVADGHYYPALMFSPEFVRALRSSSKLPFDIHLMVANPLSWIRPFVEAGADTIIFDFKSASNPATVIAAIKSAGKRAGINLTLNDCVDEVQPYWKDLDFLAISGTAAGDEKAEFAAMAVEKIHLARELIFEHRWKTELEAEGGIVRQTLPLLKAAGADYIVAGPLLGEVGPKKLRQTLDTL